MPSDRRGKGCAAQRTCAKAPKHHSRPILAPKWHLKMRHEFGAIFKRQKGAQKCARIAPGAQLSAKIGSAYALWRFYVLCTCCARMCLRMRIAQCMCIMCSAHALPLRSAHDLRLSMRMCSAHHIALERSRARASRLWRIICACALGAMRLLYNV